MKLLLISVLAFLVFAQSACQDSSKELELKQKELALKEKELEMKAKEKDNDDKKDKPTTNSDKKDDSDKKDEPTAKKDGAGSSGCALTNEVRFKTGTSMQTFKCELATNTGNTKHRYTLQADAGQDLTITLKSSEANYDVVDPDGVRYASLPPGREQIPINKKGRWVINVNLDQSVATVGDYTINFEIR